MKKYLQLIGLFLFSSFSLNAQQGKIIYEAIFNLAGYEQFKGVLRFEQTAPISRFGYTKSDIHTNTGTDGDPEKGVSGFKAADYAYLQASYYSNRETRQLLSTERSIKNLYVIEEELPSIEWEISDSTKMIDRFHCQLARGEFRGRKYVVWFTPDLPLPIGPWKLGGLPGVILEAQDTTLEVQFMFRAIELPCSDRKDIVPHTQGKKGTVLECYREDKETMKDIAKKINTKNSERGDDATFSILKGNHIEKYPEIDFSK